MEKIAVIVCNFASITDEIMKEYGIAAIYSKPYWPEEEGLVGNNIFEKMRDALKKGVNSMPKTSQPSMGTFKKYFDEGLKENEHVICITISSKISGTYNAALQTKKLYSPEMQERIHIVDSNNIDAAESLLAIKAVELSRQGRSIGEIIEALSHYIPNTYFYGMTENPNQMEAGGRISHVLAVILAQMQKIGLRPILQMEDGEVKPGNLKMNAKDIAEALFSQFENLKKDNLAAGKRYRVAISHADNISGAEKLRSLFEGRYPSQTTIDFVSMTGTFIGSHVGPGTLMCCVLEE